MIEAGVSAVQAIIVKYGVFGVLGGTLMEEIIAPIPSALVPLAAGFSLIDPSAALPSAVITAFTLIAPAVALGIGIGSSAVYAIAPWGGKPVIDRYGKLLGTSWDEIQRLQARFTGGRADEVILFGLRLVPVIPGVAISGMCGGIRYPFKRFLTITVIASYLRAGCIALLGWQAGELYIQYLDVIDKYEHIILGGALVAIVLAVGIYLLRKR